MKIADLIQGHNYLRVADTITYPELLNINKAQLERIVKDRLSKQLANHIYDNLSLKIEENHNEIVFQQETYFFTRAELLQLAQKCYNSGVLKSLNLTPPIVNN